MTTNKYFRDSRLSKSEQNLFDDLIQETIEIWGEDVIYLPRNKQNVNEIFGDDVLSNFDDWYEIDMFIKNTEGFEGDGDLFRKFGIDIKDRITFLVSRAKFDHMVEGDFDPARPREGDLIYLPLNDALFEIKHVDPDKTPNFYQIGDLYTYEIDCEQFAYSNEEFDTGIEDIDQIEVKDDHIARFTFEGGLETWGIEEGDIIFQGTYPSDTDPSAIVVCVLNDTEVEVRNVKGVFEEGTNTWSVDNTLTRTFGTGTTDNIVKNPSAQNEIIEIKADDIVSNVERDPFTGEEI